MMGTIRGLITLALFIAFAGLVVWLFFMRSRKDYDEAARIPLDNDSNGDRHE